MKEHPIPFIGPMVRAILDGRKTQTRRVVRVQIDDAHKAEWNRMGTVDFIADTHTASQPCPYKVGDQLWVRETFGHFQEIPHYGVIYRADYKDDEESGVITWKPSIHIPRSASRITLEIVNIRVERLQDITEEDAKAEGLSVEWSTDGGETPGGSIYFTEHNKPGSGHRNPIDAYRLPWNTINAERGHGWDANPWVWVLQFKLTK